MLILHAIIEQIYELLPPPPQEKPKKHMDSSLGGHLELAKSSQNDTQSNKIEGFRQKEQFYGYIYMPQAYH